MKRSKDQHITLEATTYLEVVEKVTFNSTTYPDSADTGEQFTTVEIQRKKAR